ncbi:MAG: BON domain-containing protein [Bacteroidetes bacterium]|nr:BON domain-containing protein [Bacteroidota bacterium]
MKNDQQLQQDVMDELKWDPILNASEIGVSVKKGIVTLSGYVNSYSKKIAAESAAKRVKGVSAIAEDIEVRLGLDDERNDTEIAEAALDALKWNSNVPNDRIKIKVENGWLILEGEADWQYQKDAAANAVRDITGVKGISNLVMLAPKADVSVIEKNIRRALQRSADIEANNIDIRTVGNKVIIKGKARSWAERSEIERAAWSSPGVTEIEDDLLITT